jgi:hypothetical protein
MYKKQVATKFYKAKDSNVACQDPIRPQVMIIEMQPVTKGKLKRNFL